MKPNLHNERHHRNRLRKTPLFLKSAGDCAENVREKDRDGRGGCFRGRARAETAPGER